MTEKPDMEKPRRLEDATAEYLAEIANQYADLCKRSHQEDMEESKAVLVENVLKEIASRTASAACDRRTNYLMEQLCFEAGLPILVQLLQSWAPYCVFLARNRFASHIIQAVISRIGFLARSSLIDSDSWPALEEAVLTFATPLMLEISWLGREMSASHVVRSLLCLLLGLPILFERKSKKSKHQHSVGHSEPLEALQEPGHLYIGTAKCFVVPPSFQRLVVSSVDKLLTKSSHDLQSLVADVSSCAIVTMLLRLLAGPDLVPDDGPRLLGHIVNKVLLLESQDSEQADARSRELFYTMAGDRMGSYFLETLLEVAPYPLLCSLLDRYRLLQSAESMLDYAQDASGNFLIQALLRRISMEMPRARQLATSALQLFSQCSQPIAKVLVRQRPMVLYWLLETASALRDATFAQSTADMVWTAFAGVDPHSETAQLAGSLSQVFEAPPSRESAATASSSGNGSSQAPTSADGGEAEAADGQRPSESFQLHIAKLLNACLRSPEDKVQQHSLHLLAQLSPLALRNIAVTGSLSKLLLDYFLTSPAASSVDVKLVSQKLASYAKELALHFAGHHVVRRAYEASDVRGKEKWVVVLLGDKASLGAKKEGRAVLQLVHAEAYERDATAWRAEAKKQLKTTAAAGSSHSRSDVNAKTGESKQAGEGGEERDAEEDGEERDEKTRRKRKRKRPTQASA